MAKLQDLMTTYRFEADVCDCIEMLPWIRTFFGRIEDIKCDNKRVIEILLDDLMKMGI